MTSFFQQWIFPSLMAWACIFQDDNARIERAQIVKSMRHHFQKWISHHRVQTLTPLIIFEMYWRNGEKLLQLWTVTFHKHIKTMPRRMCAVIKAKWGPIKYYNFWPGSVYCVLWCEAGVAESRGKGEKYTSYYFVLWTTCEHVNI